MAEFLVFIVAAIAIVIAVIALAQVGSLAMRIQRLEARLREGNAAPKKAPVQPAPSVRPAAEPKTAGPRVTSARPGPGPSPPRAAPVREPRKPGEWEALIGEKWLNRIGALALIIGTAFFLKYSFDRGWIPPILRVALGLVTGSALVWLASRQRQRLPVFSQGVLGAGISVLYLSVFAAHDFYGLIGYLPAVAAMSAVTAIAIERGHKADSLATALLGWAGGFLTPIVLSSGSGTAPGGLFTYLVLLNVALVGMAYRREGWWILQPLSLIATYAIYAGWRASNYRPEDLGITLVFLTAVWLMYFLSDVLRTSRSEPPSWEQLASAMNGLLFYGSGVELLDPAHGWALPVFSISLAIAHVVPSLVISRSIDRHIASAVILLAIATAQQMSGFTLVIAWAIQGAALAWFGARLEVAPARWGGSVLVLLSLIAFMTVDGAFAAYERLDYRPLLTMRALAAAAVIAGAVLASASDRMSPTRGSTVREPMMHLTWILAGLLLITVETTDFFGFLESRGQMTQASAAFIRPMTVAGVWAGYGLFVLWLATLMRIPIASWAAVVIIGIGLLAGAMRGLTVEVITEHRPLLNSRVAGLLWLMAVAYGTLVAARGGQDSDLQRIIPLLAGASLALLMFILVTGEVWDYYRKKIELQQGSGTIPLADRRQLALSSAWLIYSIVAMAVGFIRRMRAFRLAAMALFAVTILKVFFFDLSFLAQPYRMVSFIALGGILLAVSFFYQRFRERLWGEA